MYDEDPETEKSRNMQALFIVILVPHVIGLLALVVHGLATLFG